LGAFISSTSFPTAVPYIGALEKIAASSTNSASKIALVLYYNFIYILPTIIPFAIYLALRKSNSNIGKHIHLHTERINAFMTLVKFSGIGLYFVADSVCYLAYSHPIFKTRPF
jgi:hypothetical protein